MNQNLANGAPELSAALAAGANVARVRPGPEGPGLIYGRNVIHDHEDPWGEAQGWIDHATGGQADQKPALALIFGLGLGYHLELLRRAYPGIRFLVFEPTPELINIYELHKVFAGAQPPTVVSEWRDYEELISQELVYSGKQGVIMLASPGYMALAPEVFKAFAQFSSQEVLRHSVIEKTREDLNSVFLGNLAQNAAEVLVLPDLMVLKGRLPARPAFIVGAGPSLDQNAEFLREVGPRGLVLAASTALKPLLAKGISPDVVLVLEPSDTSSFLNLSPAELEILGPKCILALASSCHPNHFKVKGFLQAVFHLSAGVAQTFGQGTVLPQGGNVGSAAFALAYAWGLGPLVLVAQDQAYSGGRLHAKEAPGQVAEKNGGDISVAGVGGSTVETHSGLLASLSWFAESARIIAATQSPPRLFNCSAEGARIPGFTEASLKDIVTALPAVKGQLDLPGVLPRIPLANKKEALGDIHQLAGLVSAFRRLSRMDPKKVRAELDEAARISPLLAQVLLEARKAEDKAGLIAALDQADGLMSTMLSSLQRP